jgi:hypothetical protein
MTPKARTRRHAHSMCRRLTTSVKPRNHGFVSTSIDLMTSSSAPVPVPDDWAAFSKLTVRLANTA